MAQLHAVDDSVEVFCNRGVNGIDGCLSTAIGYATSTARPTFVVIGDLTFFYDMNAMGIRGVPDNLRILLLNNGGGAVMHVPLPSDYSAVAGRHVSAEHGMSARGWVESLGIDYSAASTEDSTAAGMAWLTDLGQPGPRVLEVFTEKISDIAQLRAYYSGIAGTQAAHRPPTGQTTRRKGAAAPRTAVAEEVGRGGGGAPSAHTGRSRSGEGQKASGAGRDGTPVCRPGRFAPGVGGDARGGVRRLRRHRPGDLVPPGVEWAEVYVLGRDLARLEAVVDEIRAGGGTAHAAQVDLLDDTALTEFFASLATSTSWSTARAEVRAGTTRLSGSSRFTSSTGSCR